MIKSDGQLEFVVQVRSDLEGKLLLVIEFKELCQLSMEALWDTGNERLSSLDLIAEDTCLEVHHS